MNLHNEPRRWHILRVKPTYEKQVGSALKYIDTEVYVPVMSVIKRWSDQEKQVLLPMFPGYVFCNIYSFEKEQMLCVNHVYGFGITNNESKPVTIPGDEIAIIKLLEKGHPEISSEQQYCGEEVMIAEGPFSGFHGIIIEKYGIQRLLVKLVTVKQFVSVDVSPFEADKANASHYLAS